MEGGESLEFLPRRSWLFLARSCFLGLGWETEGPWPVPRMGTGAGASTFSSVLRAVGFRPSSLRLERDFLLNPGLCLSLLVPAWEPRPSSLDLPVALQS